MQLNALTAFHETRPPVVRFRQTLRAGATPAWKDVPNVVKKALLTCGRFES